MEPDRTTEAERTLAQLDRLRDRSARRARGGAWLPALGIAVLLLASSALYQAPFGQLYAIEGEHPYWAGLPDQQRSPVASYLFWFLGVPLLLAGSAWWYRRRARRLGVRTPWPAFAATGLGVLLLLAVIAAVPTSPPPDTLVLIEGPFWPGLLTPLLAPAAMAVALGWVERSRGLVVAGVWIVALSAWLCTVFPLGTVPGWLIGGGPAPGQLAWRPGHYLVLMALPLLAVAAARLVSTRRPGA
ncbi:hypothetical protein [Micromonospora endolithica]|uniref:Uncharacterized protein n=1 Tax=Micromonospora endolithica TaxID=230091 RepID=A0A3A9YZR1_9ACTN|nr:hypothetical protein [Micromonospora endolithica]RKN40666.1 hypothetical protein D7223_26405 [Micromonospora endolithica]TWJ21756.1 hypothetical protein JD76_01867 [Micromonospora endolithica]